MNMFQHIASWFGARYIMRIDISNRLVCTRIHRYHGSWFIRGIDGQLYPLDVTMMAKSVHHLTRAYNRRSYSSVTEAALFDVTWCPLQDDVRAWFQMLPEDDEDGEQNQ